MSSAGRLDTARTAFDDAVATMSEGILSVLVVGELSKGKRHVVAIAADLDEDSAIVAESSVKSRLELEVGAALGETGPLLGPAEEAMDDVTYLATKTQAEAGCSD